MHSKEETLEAFGRLLDVLARLRRDCPWDRKQTSSTLRPNTIEEVYELSEALLCGDVANVIEELGDVMEHIIFYAIIGAEKNDFDMADVCNREADKLISRHPHVYGSAREIDTVQKVLMTWEQIKQIERGKKGAAGILSGVPVSLPSLIKAYRIQEKTHNVGFDWKQPSDVWSKVYEELSELRAAIESNDKDKSEEETGDFIFTIVNVARLYHLNPDSALERANQKFIKRFSYIERKAREQGIKLRDMTLEQMDDLWNAAKGELNNVEAEHTNCPTSNLSNSRANESSNTQIDE